MQEEPVSKKSSVLTVQFGVSLWVIRGDVSSDGSKYRLELGVEEKPEVGSLCIRAGVKALTDESHRGVCQEG